MKIPTPRIIIGLVVATCAMTALVAGCASQPAGQRQNDLKAQLIGHAPQLTPAQQQQAEAQRQAAQARGQAQLLLGQSKAQMPSSQHS